MSSVKKCDICGKELSINDVQWIWISEARPAYDSERTFDLCIDCQKKIANMVHSNIFDHIITK